MGTQLSNGDKVLVEEARRIIAQRFKENWHHIGCALRTHSGRVFSAVHLEAYVGRIAVCAEAVAIGMGAAVGDTEIDTIVAVNRHGQVVAPCGMCRELIADYSSTARVIVPGERGEEVVPVAALLPNKYVRKSDTQPSAEADQRRTGAGPAADR
jgi:cytidine deaminase